MTVTLDGKTLTVLEWSDNFIGISTKWMSWSSGGAKPKVAAYGYDNTITLHCVENGVTWANSVVPYFRDKMASGAIIVLVSDETVRVFSSANVCVIGVSEDILDIGTNNIRHYALVLQEL